MTVSRSGARRPEPDSGKPARRSWQGPIRSKVTRSRGCRSRRRSLERFSRSNTTRDAPGAGWQHMLPRRAHEAEHAAEVRPSAAFDAIPSAPELDRRGGYATCRPWRVVGRSWRRWRRSRTVAALLDGRVCKRGNCAGPQMGRVRCVGRRAAGGAVVIATAPGLAAPHHAPRSPATPPARGTRFGSDAAPSQPQPGP